VGPRWLLFAMIATAGCVAEEEEPLDEGTVASEVREGEFTFERPEIGMLVANGRTLCTGSLITDTVVLTAAHCVEYATKESNGQKSGYFRVEKSATEHHDFDYDAFVSFGRSTGSEDIALVRLTSSVPATIAKPATLATAHPSDRSNELVTLFGYGCSNRPGLFTAGGGDGHSQRKQKREFPMGPVRYGCPGDSGGPTVRSNGSIFRVSSKIYFAEVLGWGLPDTYGDVVRHRERILDRIEAWKE
jgi:hypothetical protein